MRPALARDIVAVVAFLALVAGLSWAYPPLGPIVGGALVLGGLIVARVLGWDTTAEPPNADATPSPGERRADE